MSPAEKDQLRRKWEWFQNASPEVRAELRELDATVRRDPRREELMELMRKHHEWFQQLPAATQRSMRGMEVEKRVEFVQQIHRRQSASRMLASAELREIMRELFQFAVEKYGGDKDKAGWVRGMRGDGRPRMNDWMARRLLDRMDEEQFARVVAKLSPESQRLLAKLDSFEDRQSQLAGWIKHTIDRRYRQYGQVPDEQLRELFLKLPDYQRDRLEALPPEQMKEELTRMYRMQNKMKGPPPGGRPKFGPPSGRGEDRDRDGRRGGDRDDDGNRGSRGRRSEDSPRESDRDRDDRD